MDEQRVFAVPVNDDSDMAYGSIDAAPREANDIARTALQKRNFRAKIVVISRAVGHSHLQTLAETVAHVSRAVKTGWAFASVDIANPQVGIGFVQEGLNGGDIFCGTLDWQAVLLAE